MTTKEYEAIAMIRFGWWKFFERLRSDQFKDTRWHAADFIGWKTNMQTVIPTKCLVTAYPDFTVNENRMIISLLRRYLLGFGVTAVPGHCVLDL